MQNKWTVSTFCLSGVLKKSSNNLCALVAFSREGKMPLGVLVSHSGVSWFESRATPYSSFLITSTMKGSRFWFKYLDPCHPGERYGLSTPYRIQPGPALAATGIWRVNQEMRNSLSTFQINKQKIWGILWHYSLL